MLSRAAKAVSSKGVTRSFGFFSSDPVNPPGLFIVGAEAILGYDSPKRTAFLGASVSVLKDVPSEAVTAAISFVDEHAAAGIVALPLDYSLAVNAAIAEFAKQETNLSDRQIEDIMAIDPDIHSSAVIAAMEIKTPVLDILEAVSRGSEDCKVVLAADAGPIFNVVVERDFPAIFGAIEGNIITSCELGKPLLGNTDGFKSIASKYFVEPKRAFFVDTNNSNVQTAKAAGLLGHRYRGNSLLQEELVRLGLTYKKHPITGKISEKAGQ